MTRPSLPGTPGPVAVGEVRRFLSTLQGEDGDGILVRKYTDQRVTVVEQRPIEADDGEEYEPMWTVRAEDGTEFAAWESELTEGGSNVYVTPEGAYVDNPEWKGYDA